MPPEPGDPTVCRAWPGGRDNLQQLVEQRTPSGGDDVGFNGADSHGREAVGVRGARKSRPRATRAGRLGSHSRICRNRASAQRYPSCPPARPRAPQGMGGEGLPEESFGLRPLSLLEGHIPQAVEGGPVGGTQPVARAATSYRPSRPWLLPILGLPQKCDLRRSPGQIARVPAHPPRDT
jgi:hypothetical protein